MRKRIWLILFFAFISNCVRAEIRDTSFCKGETVILPSDTIANSTYKWQMRRPGRTNFVDLKNGFLFQDVFTDSLGLINIPTHLSGVQFRCVISTDTVISYSDTFLLRITATWTGTFSSKWYDTRNWACGSWPDKYTEAFIPEILPGSNILRIDTTISVKKMTLLPGGQVFADSPAYVIIFNNEPPPPPPDTVSYLRTHGIWRAFEGYIGDAEIRVVSNTEELYACGNSNDYTYIDSVHLVYNSDTTGYLRFFVLTWGIRPEPPSSCNFVAYNEYIEMTRTFTWEIDSVNNTLTMAFDDGLVTPNDDPFEFHVLAIEGSLLHLFSVLQLPPDDLYFNVTFE